MNEYLLCTLALVHSSKLPTGARARRAARTGILRAKRVPDATRVEDGATSAPMNLNEMRNSLA